MEQILTSQLIISLFIILILYSKKQSLRFTSEKVLFFYLILLMIRSTIELITNDLDVLLKFPYVAFINQSSYFLDGLFIFLYVSLLDQKKINYLKTAILLIPFIVFSSITFLIAIKTDINVLREFIVDEVTNNTPKEWNLTGSLYFILVILYNLSLYLYSYKLFIKKSKSINEVVNITNDLNLTWQKTFINSWFVLYFIPFSTTFFLLYYKGANNLASELIFSISILLLTFILGLKKIKIKNKLVKIDLENSLVKKKSENKYGTLRLNKTKIEMLGDSIKQLVSDPEILSDSELNLSSFSEKINEKDYIVSQVINTLYEMSFQDFINKNRIELSKNILAKHPDYKIIHVAIDCGYKSSVTFNRQFKKYVGMTPTSYKKTLLNNK